MQTRPSTIYIRRCCVKRRTVRYTFLFILLMVIMLLCDLGFVTSLLISGAAVALVKLIWGRGG